jgi:putative ubiquitin-RnfH superfamily antitoxin RatB of RatAB toxin-antitoxin module
VTEPVQAVEVAYATPGEQLILSLPAVPGLTVEQAIRRSGILERFPEIDLAANKVGIFGKLAALDTELAAGDRVEIYRPLIADPKAARKKRAAQGKAMKKGAREADAGDSGPG